MIDKFGKFPYVLVKLSDRMAGNKLIVRGKNGRSEPQLVSAVSKEVNGWLQSLQVSSSARLVKSRACALHAYGRDTALGVLYGHVGTCHGLREAAACGACVDGEQALVDAVLRKRHSAAMCGLAAPDVLLGCLQVLSVTAKGRLPQASVTLMGSGLMEWSRERDRVINVSAGQSVGCTHD